MYTVIQLGYNLIALNHIASFRVVKKDEKSVDITVRTVDGEYFQDVLSESNWSSIRVVLDILNLYEMVEEE
jgi:hypothetical protein